MDFAAPDSPTSSSTSTGLNIQNPINNPAPAISPPTDIPDKADKFPVVQPLAPQPTHSRTRPIPAPWPELPQETDLFHYDWTQRDRSRPALVEPPATDVPTTTPLPQPKPAPMPYQPQYPLVEYTPTFTSAYPNIDFGLPIAPAYTKPPVYATPSAPRPTLGGTHATPWQYAPARTPGGKDTRPSLIPFFNALYHILFPNTIHNS